MTPLPARRAPSRCDDGASARAFTRRPTTAGATRRTYEGSGETALGGRRGGDGRVTATAGSAGTRNSTARSAVRRRRIIGPPGSTVAVLALVPRAELARLQRPPPGLVLAVPAHRRLQRGGERIARRPAELPDLRGIHGVARSEEHTSELQSHSDLVCR